MPAKNASYLAQVSDTIFTRSIFSFGAFAADGGSALSVVVIAASRVPVTSTLWPTCGFIFATSTSSRYMLFVLSAFVPLVPAARKSSAVPLTA